MRLCRFAPNRLGLVDGNDVRDVTAALDVLPSYRYPLPAGDMLMAHLETVVARVRTLATPGTPIRNIRSIVARCSTCSQASRASGWAKPPC